MKKLLKVSKTEIKSFIRSYEKITDNYMKHVNSNVSSIVIHSDTANRMAIIKNYI